jgi:hypothetical protein
MSLVNRDIPDADQTPELMVGVKQHLNEGEGSVGDASADWTIAVFAKSSCAA